MIRSRRTGIILNGEMEDFSLPGKTSVFNITPSVTNFIRPGRRPFSSMNPAIVLDKNQNVAIVLGAAGGTKITTAVAYVSLFVIMYWTII